jgi:hypothetical protein
VSKEPSFVLYDDNNKRERVPQFCMRPYNETYSGEDNKGDKNMSFKALLAASLVLAITGLGIPFAQAQDNFAAGNLRLSPNTTIASTNGVEQTVTPVNDGISLRGHLTAIPKGTIMMIKLDQPLSSTASRVGDPVSAQIETDVFLDNQIAIPAGSQIEGAVVSVSPAGRVGRAGSIEVQFSVIKSAAGVNIPLQAHVVTTDNSGIIKGDTDQAQVLKTLGTAVGGTAAGTLFGTAAGSLLGSAGGGAAFGLAAGSIAGLGYAVVRQGKQVVIPSGARMSIVLDQPLPIN